MSNGKIGKFKKLKRLGSGSSGSVWLCESKSGEQVAVKLLEQNLMQNENSLILDMFSNEIEISEKLSHPNIVKIQGHHISDDSVFIVMEYIDGGALDQFDSPDTLLSFEQLIDYAIPSCKALEFAASQGFIHCDIKPSNIFLSQDGTVKVSDFGAGLLLKNGKAKPEIVLGSPAYMSPEQVQCEEMSVASDIYSFGAALYRLATGRLPFFAANDVEMVRHVLVATPPKPSIFRSGMPVRLENLILRCLSKRAAERPSWAAIISELEGIGDSLAHASNPTVRLDIFQGAKKHPFFSGFSDSSLWELANAATLHSKKAKESVAAKGAGDNDLYFLLTGAVAEMGAHKDPIHISIAGEVFGETPFMGALSGKRLARSFDIDAVKDCEYIVIHPEAVEMMSTECKLEFIRAFSRMLASRCLSMTDRLSLKTLTQDRKDELSQALTQ